jgi:chaperonin GroES
MIVQEQSVVRFAPTGDRLIVRRIEGEGRSRGGVFLPQNFKEALSEGLVLAVGPGLIKEDGKLHPPPYLIGQVVLFHESSALEFDREAEDQVMLAESVVIGVKLGL